MRTKEAVIFPKSVLDFISKKSCPKERSVCVVLARKAIKREHAIISINETKSYIPSVSTIKSAEAVLEKLRATGVIAPIGEGRYEATPKFLEEIRLKPAANEGVSLPLGV